MKVDVDMADTEAFEIVVLSPVFTSMNIGFSDILDEVWRDEGFGVIDLSRSIPMAICT